MFHLRAELWNHAGFAGGLKTTLALNVAYHVSTVLGRTVPYVSLEMPVEQIRRLGYALYALHSASPKFGRCGLDYSKIKEGKLTAEEEGYLAEISADAGKLLAWGQPGTTIASIKSEAERILRESDAQDGCAGRAAALPRVSYRSAALIS